LNVDSSAKDAISSHVFVVLLLTISVDVHTEQLCLSLAMDGAKTVPILRAALAAPHVTEEVEFGHEQLRDNQSR
jgi:hypothetical protein